MIMATKADTQRHDARVSLSRSHLAVSWARTGRAMGPVPAWVYAKERPAGLSRERNIHAGRIPADGPTGRFSIRRLGTPPWPEAFRVCSPRCCWLADLERGAATEPLDDPVETFHQESDVPRDFV